MGPQGLNPTPDLMTELKHTLLLDWHQEHGAHMAAFGGYRMPLWYKSGPIQEHRAVVTGAGLFDTSHMAELLIEGPDAFRLLQRALTKDLNRCIGKGKALDIGRATYGFLLQEKGHVLDDAIVMMEEEERYLLVVNAGMGAPVSAHLTALGDDLMVAVSDLTDRLCKLDLQGPASATILKNVLAETSELDAPFPYFSFTGHYDHTEHGVRSKSGFPVMVSRTGYTGEFGFELFVRPTYFVALWEQILQAGEPEGLIACGLGARDSLRAGAMLPLSHQDIGDWPCKNHPWEFALPRDGKGFSKKFVGSEALLAGQDTDHTYAFIGTNGRKVEAGPDSDVLLHGKEIGTVLTCATDMAIDRVDGTVFSLASAGAPEGFAPKGLCCGFVKVDRELPPGQFLVLRDKRREIEVTLASDVRPDRTARMAWPL